MGAKNISVNTEIMDNGEVRTRVNSEDGSAYIRTESGPFGAWQNSHYHVDLIETYIVQRGWVAIATLVNEIFTISIEKQNNVFTINAGISHNLYLPENTIIHTVKHGTENSGDWHENKELDALTQHLSEENITQMSDANINQKN